MIVAAQRLSVNIAMLVKFFVNAHRSCSLSIVTCALACAAVSPCAALFITGAEILLMMFVKFENPTVKE